MWRLLACIVSLWVLPMAAWAAIYTYEYQGEPFYCGGPEQRFPVGSEGFSKLGCAETGAGYGEENWVDGEFAPAFQSRLIIDESKFPGGTLANAFFELTTDFDFNTNLDWYRASGYADYPNIEDRFTWVYKAGSPGHVSFGWGSQERYTPYTDFGFLRMEGGLSTFFIASGILPFDGFRIRFGPDKEVVQSGGQYTDGSPEFDPLHYFFTDGQQTIGGDSYMHARSAPGKWQLVSVTPTPNPLGTPAPVPLPASALGMLAALGALAGLGMRRRRG